MAARALSPNITHYSNLSPRRNKELQNGNQLGVDVPDDAVSVAQSDLDLRKEIKYGKPLRAAWGLVAEYSMNSTVHGVRYMFEPRRHWTERLWWAFAFLLSVYGCGRLIFNVYNKWDQSPVIVSFAEKSTPVWEIPFPAVTICPETKTNTSMLNFTEIYHVLINSEPPYNNVSNEDFARMQAVLQICDAHLSTDFTFEQNYTTNIIELLREMAPTFTDTMFHCKFRNEFQPCDKLFKEVMTEEGLCFTFNVLNSQEMYQGGISKDFLNDINNLTADHWSHEDGYDTEVPANPFTYPYRVLGPGARVGMYVVMFLFQQHLEYICRGPVQGFKILLHTPGEVPQVSKHYFRIPLEQEVLVAVKPNMITTSEGLRHYEPNRRQCFFNSERSLKFFRVYTQRNCELECLTNFTMQSCGCAKFGMPRDDTTPVCGVSKMACYNNAEDDLQHDDFVRGLSGGSITQGCNCLPACTSITYDAEISQAEFDWKEMFNAYKSPIEEFPGMIPSRLSIFFKEKQFITSRRSELYGPTDFLANCGGLLGLFMGVSLLSIVEMIYYCTLRLCCNLRARRNRKQTIRKRRCVVAPAQPLTSLPTIMVEKPVNGQKEL